MKKIFLYALLFLIPLAIQAESYSKDTFDGNKGTFTITFIGHASLLIEYSNYTLYIDPVIPESDRKKFPKADAIVITHQHDDHLDLPTIRAIEKSETSFIGNQAAIDAIGKGIVLANKDIHRDEHFTIEAIPAYNTTPDRQKFHPRNGRDNGYIITLMGKRIYIAGDCENMPEMARLKAIGIAFLPVNQPYTMTLEQAQKGALSFKPEILYPYHYSDTNIKELVKLLKGSGIEVRIRKF